MGKRGRKAVPVEKRFWTYVKKQGTCWVWTGSTRSTYAGGSRYPIIHLKPGRSISAHKFARQLQGLPVLDSDRYRPLCGTSLCVNPEHTSNSFLSETDRKEIIHLWKTHLEHYVSFPGLGEKYGVSRQRIEQIIRSAGLPHARTTVKPQIRKAREKQYREGILK